MKSTGSRKSGLAKDEQLKKFWEDLVDEWLALRNEPLPTKKSVRKRNYPDVEQEDNRG